MNKTLVLAEKPSVGRDLARILRCTKKGNGFLEGDKYIVTWALGHLVTLAEPDQYNKKYQSWNMEDLPLLPSKLKLEIIKKTSKQFYAVKSQMERKDVKDIIIATDAGREGELVARWIIEKAYVKKPIKRLWISSVTDKAIKEGFHKLKDGKMYENLYASAIARAEGDWIVGINATRALTCKYNAQLSCGRVQTPTLAMIASREDEIKSFKSKTYYGIRAEAKGIKLIWQDENTNDTKTFDQNKRDKILQSTKGQNATIIEVKKSYKKSYPPGLYDLTELQRDANRIFGYSAKETRSIMQRLYENHKVLTYPRTDSKYISSDIVDTLKDRVEACKIGPYIKVTNQILKASIKGNPSFVDNKKVSDHHAIIPTEQRASLHSLSENERKIFDLVVKRFLAVLFPPFEYEQTTIKTSIGEGIFIAKGKTVIKEGWKEVYSYQEDDENENMEDQVLPNIKRGDILRLSNIVDTTGKTKPPAYFNEGTLLQAMENPIKYMNTKDKNLIKTMGETGGLGTVATRADIIEKLYSSYLIEKKGKDIFITSKGRQLLDLAPKDLKSPELTAQWEQKLSNIAEGKLKQEIFVNEMKNYTQEIIREIKNSNEKFRHDNITGARCPECGKFMLEVNGKKGRMLICQDRECGYRKAIAKLTNARCPNCHKKMELHGEGEGQIFVCTCGYREKLSSFNARRKNEKNSLSKREVSNYLKKQKKEIEEPINSGLFTELLKLKK